jgi:hypothetical protein
VSKESSRQVGDHHSRVDMDGINHHREHYNDEDDVIRIQRGDMILIPFMEGDPSPSDKQSAPRRAPASNSAIEQEPPNRREVRRGEHLSFRRIGRLTSNLAAYLKNDAFAVSLIQATEVARNEQNRCTPNKRVSLQQQTVMVL